MRTEWKWITLEKYNLKNAKPFIAAGNSPSGDMDTLVDNAWSSKWIRGMGLSPHPRELDPGRLIVKGGYVGARDNPPTVWMAILISLPLLLSSTAIVSKLRQRNLSLRPYALALSLQLVGCFCNFGIRTTIPKTCI